jgi:hypothetical protein
MAEQREEQSGEPGEQLSEEQQKARESEEKSEQAKQKIKELEENPPEKLEDWPDDMAKYETFGGPEGEHSYDEGPEAKMGPADVRHHEGGEVTVEGEEVDPEKYKGEPIPGGPTDPNAPKVAGEKDLTEKGDRESSEEPDRS